MNKAARSEEGGAPLLFLMHWVNRLRPPSEENAAGGLFNSP